MMRKQYQLVEVTEEDGKINERIVWMSKTEKNGYWIYGENDIADNVDGYFCSECGFFAPWNYKHQSIYFIEEYHYCPRCGLSMKVRND